MSTSDQGGGDRPAVANAAVEILDLLVHRQLDVLGKELVGSYVFGSAVTEAFVPDVSDVDTVAVLRADPSPTQIVELRRMHREIVRVLPVWDDRIEATYLSKEALRAFDQGPWPAAHLSPGEPFHTIELDASWVIDWRHLAVAGVALVGAPVADVVPSIPREDYLGAVRGHLLDPTWLSPAETLGDRAFVVLTMCRGLRTLVEGEGGSKVAAASWAATRMPEFSRLIRTAVEWRTRPNERIVDDDEVAADIGRFVRYVQERVRRRSTSVRRILGSERG